MRHLAIILAVLALVGGGPAAASEEPAEPQITDRCGDLGDEYDRRVMPDWADICAGWLTTLSEEEATPELRFTLRLAGDVGQRLPAVYGAWWLVDECYYAVWQADAPPTNESFLHVDCDWEDSEPNCTVPDPAIGCEAGGERIPLPDGAFSAAGNLVHWDLRFDGALAEYAPDHAHGSTLAVRGAIAGGRVGDRIAVTFGCRFGTDQPTRCFRLGGDVILRGGDYTVGS